MRSKLLFFLFLAACLRVCCPSVYALDIPKRPSGYVYDSAHLISARAKSQLEVQLYQFEKQTSNQIVIATFPSLEDESLEDFSIRLAEAWKIGQKEKDNGIIFLIFKKERKMRIEVGYGLEGVLPDALVLQIIGQAGAYFKKGEYEQGVFSAARLLMQVTQGEYENNRYNQAGSQYRELTPEEIEAQRQAVAAVMRLIFFAALVIFVIDLFRYRTYAVSHKGIRSRYNFWEWFFRFAILLAIISILFRILIYSMLFSRGGYSSGRGGFRGGGGGSFGGGGASGGW